MYAARRREARKLGYSGSDTGSDGIDVELADLTIEHVEELVVPVMEAKTTDEVITWVRAFGMTQLLNELPASAQQSWEDEFARETEALRSDGYIRLECATRIVVVAGKVATVPASLGV